jgi:hypothetical protein
MTPIKLMVRVRRALWIAGTLLVLFTVTGFFILPLVVKSQLQKRLSAELGRPVVLGSVRVNPYALSVTLNDLEVGERGGTGSFLGWKRLYVEFGALASLTGDWVLSEIALDGFRAQVVVDHDGTLNFSDLIAKYGAAPSAAARPTKAPRPVRIGSLRIANARFDFTDNSRPKPFRTAVGPLSFTLTQFRTAGERGAPYRFEAVTEAGEKFAWNGTLAADPLQSAGDFSLENIDLAKYAPYDGTLLGADIAAGTLALHGHYDVNLAAGKRVLQLTAGGLGLRHLKIAERATGQPEIEVAALEVTGINADGVAMRVAVDRIALSGGHLAVRRAKDGTINLLTLVPPPPAESPPAATQAPGMPPAAGALPDKMALRVAEVVLDDFTVDITDVAVARPAKLGLSNLQCSLKNVTLADGAVMPLQLSLAWAPQGTLKIVGSVSINPCIRATLKADAADLAILPLSPYLEEFINARLTQGTVSMSSQVKLDLADRQPAVILEGDVRVEKLGLVGGSRSEKLAGFSALALHGLKVSTAPQFSVVLAEVTVTGPYARVIIDQDKSLNLVAMALPAWTAPAAFAQPPIAAGATAHPPKIEIAKVTISDGDFSFTDRSIEPNVHVAMTQFGGTVAGLSSGTLGKADVDLKATVDGVGPVAITGKLDPLSENKSADLNVDFKSVDLLPLSPYCGKYAGYELARGQMCLNIHAKMADRKIDTVNVVTLDQLTFGNAVNSPDATTLPVRFGVALLKDTDGRIVIDVPVAGSLDDPDFRIGQAVERVIVDRLSKAAVSPFSLLGAMFGGAGDELAYQEFAPGAVTPLPAESKKLDILLKALTSRPGLSLDLDGSYDAAADTYALRQQKVAGLVRRKIWEARHAADPNFPPPEQLTIAAGEYAAMVKELFDQRFPPGTEFGTPLPKPPQSAPPPQAPTGIVKRVVRAITFEAVRDRRAEEKKQAKVAAKLKQETAAVVAAGLPLDIMTGRLAETMEVTADDLRALAAQRAEQVRDHFLTVGKIAQERLFMVKNANEAGRPARGPRVFLTLR